MTHLPSPRNGFYYCLDELDGVAEHVGERIDALGKPLSLHRAFWRDDLEGLRERQRARRRRRRRRKRK